MNREEAILCLSVHSSTNGSGLCTDEQHYEAKQMAIEALEQEPCDDVVSRQAAIDEITEYGSGNTIYMSVGELKRRIEHLPPVTPQKMGKQKKCGKWIERESGTEDKEMGFETVIVCSHCDFPATTFYSEDCESRTQIRTHFCPNCGAKMQEAEE